MSLVRHPSHLPADLAAAVEAAAEAFVLVYGRRVEELHPKISASQLRALLVVWRHERINLSGLAEELGTIPSSASRLCDRLQAAGLLVRRTGDVDRREVTLVLTADGDRLLERARAARQAELDVVLAAMSPHGRAALLAGLEEFRAAASTDEDGAEGADGSAAPA